MTQSVRCANTERCELLSKLYAYDFRVVIIDMGGTRSFLGTGAYGFEDFFTVQIWIDQSQITFSKNNGFDIYYIFPI